MANPSLFNADAQPVVLKTTASGMEWVWRFLTVAATVLVTWAAMSTRVAVLERRVDDQSAMLAEIRADVKTLLLQRRP